jgi:hypothetical protein
MCPQSLHARQACQDTLQADPSRVRFGDVVFQEFVGFLVASKGFSFLAQTLVAKSHIGAGNRCFHRLSAHRECLLVTPQSFGSVALCVQADETEGVPGFNGLRAISVPFGSLEVKQDAVEKGIHGFLCSCCFQGAVAAGGGGHLY